MSNEYTPPRLRIVCNYQVASSGGPESVDIEFNDPDLALNSTLIAEVIAAMFDPSRANRLQSRPLRTPENPGWWIPAQQPGITWGHGNAVTYTDGGNLPAGTTEVVNNSGRPEPVLDNNPLDKPDGGTP